MPTKKADTKKNDKKPSKEPKAPPADEPVEMTPTHARTALQKLQAKAPALTKPEEDAFRLLATDALCAAYGAKTRSAAVLNEGVRWAAAIADARASHPKDLEGYSPKRFSFFLSRLSGLADAIDHHEARRGRKGDAQGTEGSAWDLAVNARRSLLSKMRTFAGMRADERKALADAAGTAKDEDSLSKSLINLAKLADSWLGRKDPASTFLAENAKLTAAESGAARAQAKSITEAAADVTLTPGARLHQDGPAVNVAEGRVLIEMREAMRLFGEANARSSAVPKLVPGPATRHILGRRGSGKDEDVDEGEDVAEGPPAVNASGAPTG